MTTTISNCPATGKQRKIVVSRIIREATGDFRTHFVIDYFEQDGTTRAEDVAAKSVRHLFERKEHNGSTIDSFINTQTRQLLDSAQPGNPDVVAEKDFYNALPCSTPIAPHVSTIGELIDFLVGQSIQIADQNNKI